MLGAFGIGVTTVIVDAWVAAESPSSTWTLIVYGEPASSEVAGVNLRVVPFTATKEGPPSREKVLFVVPPETYPFRSNSMVRSDAIIKLGKSMVSSGVVRNEASSVLHGVGLFRSSMNKMRQ